MVCDLKCWNVFIYVGQILIKKNSLFLQIKYQLCTFCGSFNPIQTRLCHVIYCHGDKSYPCLVGRGLKNYFVGCLLKNEFVNVNFLIIIGSSRPKWLLITKRTRLSVTQNFCRSPSGCFVKPKSSEDRYNQSIFRFV